MYHNLIPDGEPTDGIVPEAPWLVYCDGAWGNAGAGASTILRAIGVHHFAIFHDFLLDI
jgi:hypothetical protein